MSKLNEQKMFECISNWQQSGLSQKAWCEQNNMAYSSFHYWYKRYRMIQASSSPDVPEGFVQLMVQDRTSNAPWREFVFSTGKKPLFYLPISAEFIRRLPSYVVNRKLLWTK